MNKQLIIACMELYAVEEHQSVRDVLQSSLSQALAAEHGARELEQNLQTFVLSRLTSLLKEKS